MEEGLKNVMFYGTRREFKHPVRCGVIAAITKDAFRAREKYWKGIGFAGRRIIVSYACSEATKLKIHEHIRKGFPAKMIEIITGKRTQVEIPGKIAGKIEALAIAETPFSTGFRVHKQSRALVQAHALYCGRTKVRMEDFEEIRRLSVSANKLCPMTSPQARYLVYCMCNVCKRTSPVYPVSFSLFSAEFSELFSFSTFAMYGSTQSGPKHNSGVQWFKESLRSCTAPSLCALSIRIS